ncbi:MAG TPA: hypothetical protein VLC09_06845 [Polyangiaceae bacterium]|nr:hypothetical protein [Polyangiaceae bacterium]
MNTFRSLVAVTSAIALSLAVAACGGEDGDVDSSVGGGAGEGSDGSTGGTSSTGGQDGGTGGSDAVCITDSSEPSGSSTVIWSDGEVAENLTATFGNDGQLEPANLTVPVNERFGITNPPGGDLRAIAIGCADAQTLSADITAGFIINEPGVYEVYDEAANGYQGATVGTITVE